jgi:hypothetical protein
LLRDLKITTTDYMVLQNTPFQLQWPRGLRHEVSVLAQTLGSWFRISLDSWLSVQFSPVFVLPLALRRADPPTKESYRLPVRFIDAD